MSYPWYDSVWLTQYERAKSIVRTVRPQLLDDFTNAFSVFHTRPDFKTRLVEQPFDDATLAEIRRVAASLRPMELALHETRTFGRFTLQSHPHFTAVQERAVSLVSDIVGERVEASYNILSLYTNMGVCPVHMDAPMAKWTLDLCLDQSAPWPIYFSQVRPWPDSDAAIAEVWPQVNWAEAIKTSPSMQFTPQVLQPGQAVIFSGSSQWHYRDAMPDTGRSAFCTLLFLHFVPRGTLELVRPANWARLFGIPELSQAIIG